MFFFFNDTATTEIYTLSLHDALPIWKFAEALEEFGKAESIFSGMNNRRELARLYYEYALNFRAKGELMRAREYLEKAIDIFEAMGMKWWVDKTNKALEMIG